MFHETEESPIDTRSPESSSRTVGAAVVGVLLVSVFGLVAVGASRSQADLYMEAEDAQITGAFAVVEANSASGGAFVHVPKKFKNVFEYDGSNAVSFCFEVTEPGAYGLSAKAHGLNKNSNSFFVRLDYHEPWTWELQKSGGFSYLDVASAGAGPGALHLDAGQHVVSFVFRESGTRLDGVFLTNLDGLTAPQGCESGEGDSDESRSLEPTTTTTSDLTTTSTADDVVTTTTGPVSTTSTFASTTTTERVTTTTVASTTTTTSNATTTTTAPASTTSSVAGGVPSGFDGVVVPGDDVNGVLQSLPEGASVLLRSGVYRRLVLEPRSGQVIVGESGTVLDGEGVAPYAIGGEWLQANDITLRNLKIVNYTDKCVDWGAKGWGYGWTVENSEIAYCRAGIKMKTGGVYRNNHIHHNTTYGLYSSGENIVVEGNEISYNYQQDSGGADGAVLFVNHVNAVVRNNYVHHNYDHGLHFDGHTKNASVTGNVVTDNAGVGIFYELGYKSTISGNEVRRNGLSSSGRAGGGAGILVFNAHDVTVKNNVVAGNRHGIVGKYDDRCCQRDGQAWSLKNLVVSGNTIAMSQGYTGVYDNTSQKPGLNANNTFVNNNYQLNPANGQFFRWHDPDPNTQTYENLTLAQWQQLHPNDG